jgi:A/G-specific adenine glycosylase
MCAWQRAGCPPYRGPALHRQPWAGTDRAARGRLLAVLRDAPTAVPADALAAAGPSDHEQYLRCLAGLVADGLVQPLAGNRYGLPGAEPYG